jgi:hypothetical protein
MIAAILGTGVVASLLRDRRLAAAGYQAVQPPSTRST